MLMISLTIASHRTTISVTKLTIKRK